MKYKILAKPLIDLCGLFFDQLDEKWIPCVLS